MDAFLGPPAPPLNLLWPSVPAAALALLLRFVCLRIFGDLGTRLASWLHGPQWKTHLKAHGPQAFAERCFYALIHTICTIVGGRLCWSCGWLTTPGAFFFAMPWPHELPPAQLAATRAYYVLEGSLALESTGNLLRESLRAGPRKRDLMMVVHHAVTLLLIVASWKLGILETGSVVLWLHAASDVGIDLLKAADEIKWEAALGPCWGLSVVGWVGFRFILLPYHLLRPGWHQISLIAFGVDCSPYPKCPPIWSGRRMQPEFIPGSTAWLGLLVLLALHAIWLKQILMKALPVLFPSMLSGGKSPDGASRAELNLPDACAPGFVRDADAARSDSAKAKKRL